MTNIFYVPREQERFSLRKFAGRKYYDTFFGNDKKRDEGFSLSVYQCIYLNDRNMIMTKTDGCAELEFGVIREINGKRQIDKVTSSAPDNKELFPYPILPCSVCYAHGGRTKNTLEFLASPTIEAQFWDHPRHLGGPIILHFNTFEELEQVKSLYFLLKCFDTDRHAEFYADDKNSHIWKVAFVKHNVSFAKPAGVGMNLYGLSSFFTEEGVGYTFNSIISQQKTKKKAYYCDVPKPLFEEDCPITEDGRELLQELWDGGLEESLLPSQPDIPLCIDDILCYESSAKLKQINLAELGAYIFLPDKDSVSGNERVLASASADDMLAGIQSKI